MTDGLPSWRANGLNLENGLRRRIRDLISGLGQCALTVRAFWSSLLNVQLTIEIPDQLARELEPERERVAEIIARGLRRSWSRSSSLRREVISFLARRPAAAEIIEFRPSEPAAARAAELLQRNQAGALTPAEEAELDEICDVDRFVSLIKAEVLAQQPGAA